MTSTMVTSTQVTTTTATDTTKSTDRNNTRTPSTSSSTSTINDLQDNGHYFPSLYELVDNTTSLDSNSNTTLAAFHRYLLTRHCPENLQFIIDINSYLHLSTTTRIEILKSWQYLYDKYLTFDADLEINLPCNLKSQLSIVELPSYDILSQCKKHIYDDLLINLYKEFTKQYQEDTYRPCFCKRRTSSIEQINHHHQQQQQQQQQPTQIHIQSLQHVQSQVVQHHPQHQRRQSLKHTLSLNLPHRAKLLDDNVCPIEKVTPVTSPISHKEEGEIKHHHHHHHHHHDKQYGGYDYYTIPSTESSSEEEHSDGVVTKSNSRNNSTSSSSRGSSIGSIVDNSFVYFSKMKKLKFGRRFSNDE
ncbi:hypothetical protein Cantr_09169 [Candida viswanathii]|uniref:RGS domain-containing protein n=1 Tax=Candida viswanathii TaxID=5486 RepID=A0A367YA86_9ASCO|nr:hypothetical protein Cantr_09169 [Candida viswanathii]